MPNSKISFIVSYGQSLSVGAEGVGAISTTPIFPQNALMLGYDDQEKIHRDWGAIGPKGDAFDPLSVVGLTPLINYNSESHTTAMINTIINRHKEADEEAPILLNISSGAPGQSIESLSDKNGIYYQNLIQQIRVAADFAIKSGYTIDPNISFYWMQGASNGNDYHKSYSGKIQTLHQQVTNDVSATLSTAVTVNLFIDVSGYRGSAWGNLDYTLLHDNAHFAAEQQWDHIIPSDGVDPTGAWGGHKSNSAYYMQGAEAGHVISDVWLEEEILAGPILIDNATVVSPRKIVISFSGLLGELVIDDTHSTFYKYDNALDLGFFAYADAGKYTGGHAADNKVLRAEIFSASEIIITMENDVSSSFFLGIAGGDGGVRLRGTPLRDSVTKTAPNFFDDVDINVFNNFGGAKRFIPYQYAKVGAEGLIADAYEISGGESADRQGLPVQDRSEEARFESGKVSISQTDSTQWHSVEFQYDIPNARVVMGPLSYRGSDPANVRVQNVTNSGFQFQIEEWEYLDSKHTLETVSWLAMSAGVYTIAGELTVSAGRVGAKDHDITGVELTGFQEAPSVFAQVSSKNGSQAVVPRLSSVGADGFSVRMQEEEHLMDGHFPETIDWIAVERGTSGMNTSSFINADHTKNPIDNLATTDSFDFAFIASMQTEHGRDTAGLRYIEEGAEISVFIEEETSRDSETSHVAEEIGYLMLEIGSQDLF